jgi:dihydrofolate reductase
MRDLILKMHISIDGFVAGPDGGIKWVFNGDQEAAAWTVETVWNAGLHIMGSRTFHDMAAYWPTSTEIFAPPMNQIPKAVFSRQGPAILKAAASLRAGQNFDMRHRTVSRTGANTGVCTGAISADQSNPRKTALAGRIL